jgi:ABC-type multidrug transport system ATPase subunit
VYDRTFAVHSVSTELHAGRITAIAGDNGSGKTTLLRMIATLEPLTDGEISYDDVSRESFARHYRQNIGWLPHAPLLYDNLTGRENLEFFADMYGLAADAMLERIDDLLDAVGMMPDADRRVDAYSRGMRQRMTIARALLPNPPLLLMDEPLTGLDGQGRRDIAELLNSLRDAGHIVALTSHNLTALDQLADRLAILRNGRLTFDDQLGDASVSEVYAEYG